MGKAALNPAKTIQPSAHLCLTQPQLARDCNRREYILRIMLARHRQEKPAPALILAPVFACKDDIKARACRFKLKIFPAHIGLRIKAISHNAAVGDTADKVLHLRVINAEHRKAVKGQIIDKAIKGFAQHIKIAVMLHMLRVDIGDNGHGGEKL